MLKQKCDRNHKIEQRKEKKTLKNETKFEKVKIKTNRISELEVRLKLIVKEFINISIETVKLLNRNKT